MTPIEIKNGPADAHAVVYAKDQPEYNPLPAVRFDDGLVVTRWQLSWRERLQVLFGSGIYVGKLTFNKPLQPMKLATTLEGAQ